MYPGYSIAMFGMFGITTLTRSFLSWSFFLVCFASVTTYIRTCSFLKVLRGTKLYSNWEAFEQWLRKWQQSLQNFPSRNEVFCLSEKQEFFQNSDCVTFAPLWYLNLMQNKTSIQWTPIVSKCNPLKTEGSSGKIKLCSPNRSPNCFFVF